MEKIFHPRSMASRNTVLKIRRWSWEMRMGTGPLSLCPKTPISSSIRLDYITTVCHSREYIWVKWILTVHNGDSSVLGRSSHFQTRALPRRLATRCFFAFQPRYVTCLHWSWEARLMERGNRRARMSWTPVSSVLSLGSLDGRLWAGSLFADSLKRRA